MGERFPNFFTTIHAGGEDDYILKKAHLTNQVGIRKRYLYYMSLLVACIWEDKQPA